MDVKTAYLKVDLDVEIYKCQLEGCVVPCTEQMVCRECNKTYIYKGENHHFTFQVLLTPLLLCIQASCDLITCVLF